MASAAPPNAYAALILLRPWPGMSTTVSRGIESVALAPPPTRMSRIESDREGLPMAFAPGLLVPPGGASEPSISPGLGEVRVKPAPERRGSAALQAFDFWICAE